MSTEALLELVLNGVLIGGIYSLMAIGLSLIFGISRVLNITHGEFIMLGGMTAVLIFEAIRVNPILLALFVPLLFIPLGFIFEFALIRPLLNRPHHFLLTSSILVTFGLALFVEDTAAFIWGATTKGIPSPLPSVTLAGMSLSPIKLVVLAVVVATVLFLWFFLRNTNLGLASRAIMIDKEGALLCGVNARLVSMITFGIGSALASMAGVFHAILLSIEPYMGLPLTLIALCIIVLGGVGSMLGTLIAGITIGLFEVVIAYVLGLHWSPVVPVVVLIATLMIRPKGLFGRE